MKLMRSHSLILAFLTPILLVSTEVSVQMPGFDNNVEDEPGTLVHRRIALDLVVGGHAIYLTLEELIS